MSETRLGLLIALIVPIVFLIICVRWLLEEQRIHRQLEQSGQTLDAEVVHVERFGSLRQRLSVTYRFLLPAGGSGSQPYSRSQAVSDGHGRALTKRSKVTVAYLPDNPVISRLSGIDTDHARQYIAEAGIVFSIVIGCAILYYGEAFTRPTPPRIIDFRAEAIQLRR